MEFYQWLVPLMGLIASFRLISQYRNNQRLLKGTILWILFWLAISTLAIVPDAVSFGIADFLGFKDHINAIIFVALGFLFLFNMYFNTTLEKIEKQMTEVVRQQALENQFLKEKIAQYEKELLQRKHEQDVENSQSS